MLKTSREWQQEHQEIIVYDPDGWDRLNFQHSWFEELITEEEWIKRAMNSTCGCQPNWWDKGAKNDETK